MLKVLATSDVITLVTPTKTWSLPGITKGLTGVALGGGLEQPGAVIKVHGLDVE